MKIKRNILKVINHECDIDVEDYPIFQETTKEEVDKYIENCIENDDVIIERHKDEFCTLKQHNQRIVMKVMELWQSNYGENIEDLYSEFWEDFKEYLNLK